MERIKEINNRFENMQSKAPEWGAFLLYFISHIVLSIYHENWYDECVAWMIAKYTSVKDLLFYVPHYEGHPPLWHLILKVFAVMGVNYHVALSIAVVFFSSATVYLILFYSPFPRIIKLALPFTYYIFYQYGVISRPYCVMMFVFGLLAITYKDRNIKVANYALVLVLLGLTSAYGVIISIGLCMAWFIERLKEYDYKSIQLVKNLAKDNVLKGIVAVCGCLFIIGLEFFPYRDTYAMSTAVADRTYSDVIHNVYYDFLCIIPDTICYDVYDSKGIDLHIVVVIGMLMLIHIYLYGKKKKTLALFFIPYVLFCLFGATIYLTDHHIGIMNLFFVFWVWVSLDSVCSCENVLNNRLNVIKNNPLVIKAFSGLFVFAMIYAVSVSFYYSMFSSAKDISDVFESGKRTAEFIKENRLTDYKMMAGWLTYDESSYYNVSDSAYTVIPEFGYNIFDYQEYGCDGQYNLHVILTEEEKDSLLEKWREIGLPDVIVGEASLDNVFVDDKVNFKEDYVYVFSDLSHKIWKDNVENLSIGIYLKRDLAEKLNIKEIPKPVIVKVR